MANTKVVKTWKLRNLNEKTSQLDDTGQPVERSMYAVEETKAATFDNRMSKADVLRRITQLESEKADIQVEIDKLNEFQVLMVD